LRDALNAYLHPQPIAITRVWAVADNFHARFSALERRYLYRVLGRRPPPTLEAGRVWWVPTKLDVGAMQEASRYLIGIHDFTTFRDAQCQAKSPIKTLDALDVSEGFGASGPEIHIVARSRSFLHRQVRSMVGALVKVGRGGWKPADVAAALEARDRQRCAPVAPSDGLYLTGVAYPETALD
jgi:tRNA pseudouridine38-40 synthase